MHGSTKGTDIFRKFHATLQEAHLDPSKMFPVTTVMCLSMLGANQRLQELVNKCYEEDNLALVRCHHRILLQESLVA